MIAAVVMDDWKIPVFKRHLDRAGFKYEGPFQFCKDASTLKVQTDFAYKLQPIVEAANKECASVDRVPPRDPNPACKECGWWLSDHLLGFCKEGCPPTPAPWFKK